MKVIYFEWDDAVAGAGWSKTKNKCDECNSIGFLIEEDDEQITLAAAISGDQSNARITVPKKWLKKRKTIKI